MYMTIRELYEMVLDGSSVETDQVDYVELEGWVRTNRYNGNFSSDNKRW